MKTDSIPKGVLRLTSCTYGFSKVPFRGPRRPTDGRYALFLGGSDTFGKYVPKPYPDLVETAIGEVCVNLGCQSAGPDVFLQDSAIGSLCHDAAAVVVQILSAVNLSNRYYKVHPRRNDRFIGPTDALLDLYPEIDFAEIAFTGHLIARLQNVDPDRFAQVEQALQATWLRRMKALIGQADGPVLLIWLATRAPGHPSGPDAHPATDPMLVTREMLDELWPYVADIIEVEAPHGDTAGMSFAPLEGLAAAEMMTVAAHRAVAKALRAPLQHALI